jgi:hypothetical protein
MPKDSLDPQYLTRSDIARILRISPKQAGRLMEDMPCVLIGTTHRRVARSDFDIWIERKKLDEACEVSARRRERVTLSRVGNATPIRPRLAGLSEGPTLRRPRPLPK